MKPIPVSRTIPAKRSADTQEAAWVAQEDEFVLKQAKKKAAIRVKEGRARPIDWLAVILRVVDPERDLLDDDLEDSDVDVVDPDGVFEGLSDTQLSGLEKDIDTYLALEKSRSNREFWKTMKVICDDRLQKSRRAAPEGRVASSVISDIDKLLAPKSFDELERLEVQIRKKLSSNEPIDVEYWERLLRSLTFWKAKSTLRKVYQSVINSRLNDLRKQQHEEAQNLHQKLQVVLEGSLPRRTRAEGSDRPSAGEHIDSTSNARPQGNLDPEPLLKIRGEDKGSEVMDERDFLKARTAERQKVVKMGFVPMRQRALEKPLSILESKFAEAGMSGNTRFASLPNTDFSQATKALYEREVARGVSENEEIFTAEEDVSGSSKSRWTGKYRPRKPRYFNRVQMGYEWNKYNQTHYDHDNPPPKVVQGYKFNIFYPDLIDKTKAPTYRIEREHGRKRGQSFAPAGEEDTCLIRFVAGPPYEDIAFRIVDKEWDYSAKRERGFRSSFDKGILQLHFQFKKVYYRK